MNKEQRQAYAEMNIRQMKRFERKYLRRIYDALLSEVTPVAEVLEVEGIQSARRKISSLLTNDQMASVIMDLYIDAGLFYARKTWREINRSIRVRQKAIGFNEEWTTEIINFIRQYLLVKAVWPVTDATKQNINAILDKGIEEGWTIEAMVSKIKSSEMIAWRARLIARTELAMAAFIGRKKGEEKSEYETNKEWISAGDIRVRHSHQTMDGETISSESRFQVPLRKGGYEMMEAPGDPAGSAENLCNCRCTVATVAARDENGRLIPKRTHVAAVAPGLFTTNNQTITI